MELSAFGLTIYLLTWPVIVAATLVVIVRAYFKDAAAAKRAGRGII